MDITRAHARETAIFFVIFLERSPRFSRRSLFQPVLPPHQQHRKQLPEGISHASSRPYPRKSSIFTTFFA